MKLLQNEKLRKMSESEIEELRAQVKAKIENENLKFSALPFMIGGVAGAIISFVALLILFVFNPDNTIKTVLVIVAVLGAAAALYLGYKYSRAKVKNEMVIKKFKMIRDQAFINWFNKYYEDIVIKDVLTPRQIASWYIQDLYNLEKKETGSDFNTSTKIYSGYRFETKKGLIIDTFITNIVQPINTFGGGGILRLDNNQSFIEMPHFCAVINNNDPKWDGFEFRIDYSHNNDNSLENRDFNQILGYRSNDPIRLRMLLTPWTQEKLIKMQEYRWALTKERDIFFWYGKYLFDNNVFDFKYDLKPTVKQIINSITDDIVADIEIIQNIIQQLSIYKSIIE